MSENIWLGEVNNKSDYSFWKYGIQRLPQFLDSRLWGTMYFSFIAAARPCRNDVSKRKGACGSEESLF